MKVCRRGHEYSADRKRCLVCRRASNARYDRSAKGRAAHRAYKKSEKGRAVQRAAKARYNKSEKGRAADARYNKSTRRRATLHNWRHWLGREKYAAIQQRYFQKHKEKIYQQCRERVARYWAAGIPTRSNGMTYGIPPTLLAKIRAGTI